MSACPEAHIVDLRGEPCVLRRGQWTPHTRRDPARMRGVVLHQWDAEVPVPRPAIPPPAAVR